MRVVFTGGGSGGHIFPLVALARQLKKKTDLKLYYLGPNGFSQSFLSQEGIKVKRILAGKLRRYFSLKTFGALIKIILGFIQALFHLFLIMPEAVFSKGGYGSVPVVLAAWLYRIPIIVHESDVLPGLANQLATKLACRVIYSFPGSAPYLPKNKSVLAGLPIRFEQTSLSPEAAQKILSLDKGTQPLIFVLGGSQGAQRINQLILESLPDLLEKYQVIHQSGSKHCQAIEKIVGQPWPKGYYLYPFLNEKEMAAAYTLADLIVSRAGASCIFEIAAAAKPSIVIPLPRAAHQHQQKNALAYSQTGAAIVLEEANLTPHLFLKAVDKILSQSAREMSQSARDFSRPGAAQRVSQLLIEVIKK